MNNYYVKRIIIFVHKCPLAGLLLLSGVAISLVGLFGMIIGKYNFEVSPSHPFVAAVFESQEDAELVKNNTSEDLDDVEMATEPETVTDQNGQVKPKPTKKVYTGKTLYVKRKPAKPKSAYYDDPKKTPLTTDVKFSKLRNKTLKNSVFIGDSRIEGLYLFGGINQASFIFKEGVNAKKLLTDKLTFTKGKKGKLLKLLSKRQYENVYIMTGVNELGLGTAKQFGEYYAKLVQKVKKAQPNATIFLFGIINVGKDYAKDKVINNDNVNARNCRIAKLANGKDIIYLDVNPILIDSKGFLKSSYTTDGVHLRAEHYKHWTKFIKEHGFKKN